MAPHLHSANQLSTVPVSPCFLQSLFEEQGVCSGRVLLQLSEASLKEMGVSKVGHRLGIADCVQQLCSSANVVPAVGLVDIPSLIKK